MNSVRNIKGLHHQDSKIRQLYICARDSVPLTTTFRSRALFYFEQNLNKNLITKLH